MWNPEGSVFSFFELNIQARLLKKKVSVQYVHVYFYIILGWKRLQCSAFKKVIIFRMHGDLIGTVISHSDVNTQ